ncbi:HNH endonuclease [Macrococcus equipercicus]|uniref:Putative HNH nuclease YajD n=1 Tax=Macrococcus equipercicus TaxID=69967 RepID=A0A9Q9F2Y3_9STAP|nr:HNH endonuclease [Macrococcus equipercicus]UTH13304.1 HNH endonuclease [Macrococcus equipercicus]
MASKSESICSHPGCSRLTANSYCDQHSDVIKSVHKTYNNERVDVDEVAFYNTSEWKSVRVAVLQRDFYLCQQCKAQGITTVANTVHHIVELKDDWDKRLDMTNLETVCTACHNKEHVKVKKGLGTSTQKHVYVVMGLPGSGKSTFIDLNKDEGRDIVIDIDKLISAMTGRPLHDRQHSAYDAVSMANDMVDAVIDNIVLDKYNFKSVWIRRTAITPAQASKLKTIGARFICMDRNRFVCERHVRDTGQTIAPNVFTQIEMNIEKIRDRVTVETFTAFQKMQK